MRLGQKSYETATFELVADFSPAQWDAEIVAIRAAYEKEKRHERALKAQRRALARLARRTA